MTRVYASLPLSGHAVRPGRDLLRGAELALEHARDSPAELIVLDGFGEEPEEQSTANAQRAAEDREAVAYLGDFYSWQVLRTAPILGAAGLLQVAPLATFVDLAGPTLVRLSPHDGVGARAIAAWLTDVGVRELLLVHDHDQGYGVPVGAMCAEAARDRGLVVRSRPVWDQDERPAADLGSAEAILYVGVAGSGATALWHELHAANPNLWLLGSEGVAVSRVARELSDSAAERTRFFIAQRAPIGFYGFEAMALILDAIATGAADRAATVRSARMTRDRRSIVGRYSIDEHGHTTTKAYGRLAISGGELVWDVARVPPT